LQHKKERRTGEQQEIFSVGDACGGGPAVHSA
jgi:hypothetical protein